MPGLLGLPKSPQDASISALVGELALLNVLEVLDPPLIVPSEFQVKPPPKSALPSELNLNRPPLPEPLNKLFMPLTALLLPPANNEASPAI